MKWLRKMSVGVGVAVLAVGTVLGPVPALGGAAHDRPVSNNPDDWVPYIEDGAGVFGVATVGGVTVAGGSFTQVRERGATSSTVRNNIVAFNSSGQISTAFVPTIPTRVWDIIPAGDGVSVYVGGQFNHVNGVSRTNRIARINVHTGQVMTSFRSPGFDGKVMDLHLANGRLYAGGYFSTVGGQPRSGLVALDAQTGALTDHLDLPFAGAFRQHSSSSIPSGNSGVGVERFTMTPDGTRLVAIGNFRTVAGQSRVQVVQIDTGGATAAVTDWSTTRYSTACAPVFPTYTLGLDISPDGDYFVISTGGAFNGGVNSGTLCDTVARWEMDRSGSGQQPTWVDYIGGDTTTAIHITGSAVYMGGHFRWVNSPFVGDAVGPGAVGRKGMAALDPRNGLPLSLNAGKLPLRWGVGAFDSTAGGLWVAHDGDNINNEYTGRLGFLPLGNTAAREDRTGSLPGDVYVAGRRPVTTGPSPVVHRVNAGGPTVTGLDGLGDWQGDTGTFSPYRTFGSNASSSSEAFGRTALVPAATPTEVFATERWDSVGGQRMEWNFPVEAGLPLEVRLYFANGYTGTSQAGQRVFDVHVEGATVLDDYDIVADTGGHAIGTMKSFSLVSDGNVDIDFDHGVENPLVNAIEIIRTDIAPPSDEGVDDLVRASLTESAATSSSTVPNGGIAWSDVRGAFMVDGRLYNGWSDGTFTWRPFNGGNNFGTTRVINVRNLTAFTAEVQQMNAAWFDRVTGRMYFTLRGQNQLYYRYFTPESTTVGAVRFTVPNTGAGIDWSTVTGGFLANGKLYWSGTDGALSSVDWADGAVAGTTGTVSGPGVDGRDWNSAALFMRAQ